MRTFLVSYDLAVPASNQPLIAEAIMQLGEAWARPLANVWYLRAEESRADIEARLSHHLGCDDGLLIQEARGDAALLNTSLRWFRPRARRDDLDGEAVATNVIAFPAPSTACELPAETEVDEAPPLRAAS